MAKSLRKTNHIWIDNMQCKPSDSKNLISMVWNERIQKEQKASSYFDVQTDPEYLT